MFLLPCGLLQIKFQFQLVKKPATLLFCSPASIRAHTLSSDAPARHNTLVRKEIAQLSSGDGGLNRNITWRSWHFFIVLWESSGTEKKWKKKPLLSPEIQQSKQISGQKLGQKRDIWRAETVTQGHRTRPELAEELKLSQLQPIVCLFVGQS